MNKMLRSNGFKLLNSKLSHYSCRYFSSKVAIVTGGASGIGRATSLGFARQGTNVVIADINKDAANDTLNMIKKDSGEAIYVETNISNESDCKRLTEETVKKYGRIDILIHNAANFILKGFSGTKEEWIKSFETNVIGHAMVTKYAIEEMKKQKGASIVIVSSQSAFIAQPDNFVYAASKAGGLQLARNLSLDLAKYGIRVNSVSPGSIITPALENHCKRYNITLDDLEQEHQKTTIIGRLGRPEEVANAIIFLASEKASYITGTNLMVDGGFTVK
jgi:NAD(P)-dependent dehydrogenase (short-subunit alcohol dehydrogenase family)